MHAYDNVLTKARLRVVCQEKVLGDPFPSHMNILALVCSSRSGITTIVEVCGGGLEGIRRTALLVSFRQAMAARAGFRRNGKE